MKKVISIIVICLCCFTSCKNNRVNNDVEYVFWNSYDGKYDHGVYTTTYEGHSYLFFKEGYRMGVVHNPDCHCWDERFLKMLNTH